MTDGAKKWGVGFGFLKKGIAELQAVKSIIDKGEKPGEVRSLIRWLWVPLVLVVGFAVETAFWLRANARKIWFTWTTLVAVFVLVSAVDESFFRARQVAITSAVLAVIGRFISQEIDNWAERKQRKS